MTEGTINLDEVRAEIADEVRRRRAAGNFDVRKERELERLFHQYAPLQGRTGALTETLRAVDATAHIDPLVPVESNQPAGALVKKTMRKAGLWYIDWIAGQTTRALSTIARSLHLIDDELTSLRERVDSISPSETPVVDAANGAGPDVWWADLVRAALGAAEGRVLVAACGDGWLVRQLVEAGQDAYGLDPRQGMIMAAEIAGLDLRDEQILSHLRSVAEARLGGVFLVGVTEAMLPAQRQHLVERLGVVLEDDAVLAVHSVHPDALRDDSLDPDLDLAGGRPLRPTTWVALLNAQGFTATVHLSPGGTDFLVLGQRGRSTK